MTGRVACPRCGQDWLERVRLIHLGAEAIRCPECEALWRKGVELRHDTFVDYGTFLRSRGRLNPDAPGEVEVLGSVTTDNHPTPPTR